MLGRWLISPWPGLIYQTVLMLASWAGHPKARAMHEARRKQSLAQGPFDILIHCASLGEYWMVQPLVHQWHDQGKSVLITLFSPSGEPVRNDAPCQVVYAPWDRPTSVRRFLKAAQPKSVLFVKYDMWPVFTSELIRHGIPFGLALAHTPPGHRWVHRWSPFTRRGLKSLAFCAQQTAAGAQAWRDAGLGEVAVVGDGRVDAARQRAALWKPIPGMETFLDGRKLLVLGSAWDPEVELVLPLILKHPKLQIAIAPHDVSKCQAMADKLPVSYVKWSEWEEGEHLREARVLMIDTVGDLFRVYGHADLALVGGAFGPGLHNILEPLAFGVPVCFGPKLGQHWEAHAAIEAGLGQIINDSQSLEAWIKAEMGQDRSHAMASFLAEHAGAMDQVDALVDKHLFQ